MVRGHSAGGPTPVSPEIEELLGKTLKHEPPAELVEYLGTAYRDFHIEQLRDVIRISYAMGAMSVQEPSGRGH